ncbi:uncharacterized peptidase C1-like protein F26E4.3 [Penaeus chinensis]|uniref:uncharacterized peptidase C1-like protein F26E4.3 n=1 Tax=Penaeus chinensis TaxID=139456 RepID=UPI001FB601E9|nr:uncharacterized peptidase C1-like protein F26E4.3 [Penaeus chinensis]
MSLRPSSGTVFRRTVDTARLQGRSRMGGVGVHVRAALLLVAVAMGVKVLQVHAGEEGSFCGSGPSPLCCTGKQDNCSVPITEDDFCFCDSYCQDNLDCCPDYDQVCLGESELRIEEVRGASLQLPKCDVCTHSSSGLVCAENHCMNDLALIDELRRRKNQLGWTASFYDKYKAVDVDEGLRQLTGTMGPTRMVLKRHEVKAPSSSIYIPAEYDFRKRFKERLVSVKDQGWCGASWVFSTLSVAQDRLAMASDGLYRVSFSAQDLLSCGKMGPNGCLGGHLDRAWNYLRMVGALPEVCYPYDSGFTGKLPRCSKRTGTGCQSPYKSGPAYRVPSKEQDIQREIIANGPVQAVMTVHPDFFLYKTGVYSYSELGSPHSAAHSVKLLGWGEELVNGKMVKYWLAENSWGKDWGEGGFFRILRGEAECGIESHIFAAKPECELLSHGLKVVCN